MVRILTFNAKQFDVRLEHFKVYSVDQREIMFLVRPEVSDGSTPKERQVAITTGENTKLYISDPWAILAIGHPSVHRVEFVRGKRNT